MNGDTLPPNIKVTGLTADSRAVKPGYLFAAIPGTQLDGRAFIPDAIQRGAIAILTTPDTSIEQLAGADNITLIQDANPRRRLAKMAAAFFTPQPETIVAVTGTNGKTSVAHFTRQLWLGMGQEAGAIGTLGITATGFSTDHGLTTPDPVDLHALLADMKCANIDKIAMEASSHGLDQYRLDGVRFAAAAFTNLTRDHLDYHGSFSAYRAAKLRLFDELLAPCGCAVVNTQANEHDLIANIASERKLRLISYGMQNGNIRCISCNPSVGGFDIKLDVLGEQFNIDFPLPGHFQVENAMAALGLVIATGTAPDHAVPNLARLVGVRGRMERIATLKNGAAIYVDYAHTPDSISTVLNALRLHTHNHLHIVLGCGGDRDKGKRPLMVQAAGQLADHVIITDDNPRHEDPATIRADALKGYPQALEIGDRREAIYSAIKSLKTGDILCVAGKGHEQGQTIGSTVHPFDDADVVRECVGELDLEAT